MGKAAALGELQKSSCWGVGQESKEAEGNKGASGLDDTKPGMMYQWMYL